MAFDPETAYAGDYQYRDRIKDLNWEVPPGPTIITGLKGRWGPINTPDFVTVAASLGLSSDAAAVVVWEPKPIDVSASEWGPAFVPKPGHMLRIVATNEGWLVVSATRSSLQGKWEILVDREVLNA